MIKYNPDFHHRRSTRLRGYDYAKSGIYFITICVQSGICLLGEVIKGQVQLNRCGEIIQEEWLRSADMRPRIKLDNFVVMPNHFHGIVIYLEGDVGEAAILKKGARSAPLRRKPDTLASFLAGFKSVTTRRLNEMHHTQGERIWQRNYYEHIIRNEEELNRIREYIAANPARWSEDEYHPTQMMKTPL